jgi:hypothetical protein
MDGAVVRHPLENFDDFEKYVPPVSPYKIERSEKDWAAEVAAVNALKESGKLAEYGTDHGIMMLRHTNLRGFENAMVDYTFEDERLTRLFDMIVDYYMPLVEYSIRCNADVVRFAEDLGAQSSLIISPAAFEK